MGPSLAVPDDTRPIPGEALVLFPYKRLVPPMGGGALRCVHLLRQLSRAMPVHAVVFQRSEDIRSGQFYFPPSVAVYSPEDEPAPRTVFDLLPLHIRHRLHDRWLRRTLSGPTSTFLLESHHILRRLAQRDIRLILFDTTALGAHEFVSRLCPRAVRVWNAHNLDHQLLPQLLEGQQLTGRERREMERAIRLVHRFETGLIKWADAYLACSEDDRRTLAELNGPRPIGIVVPNGVDTKETEFDARSEKRTLERIIFCGSLGYMPNREGLKWFHQEVWPRIIAEKPNLRLSVVGRGGSRRDYDKLISDPTVDFVGEVSDVGAEYHRASLSVVPLHHGSGTRLKILESMSAGAPVVSTTIGATGIEATDGMHLLLRDAPADFASAVLNVLSDESLYERLRHGGRKLAESVYDWNIIGDEMNRFLVSLFDKTEG